MNQLTEARRQGALLATLFDPTVAPATGLFGAAGNLQRGLSAYRANAASTAERAMAAAYPTVHALIGAEDFAALSRALWRASPPVRGDLAQWGLDLPEFIERESDLAPWPYLADCARLDAAVQRCESATDAQLDRGTLGLLATQAPESLCLRLLPSVQLLTSPWPIATLHEAHQHPHADDPDRAFEPFRMALAAGRGESVVVARAGWRALPDRIDAPSYAWMRALYAGRSVSVALDDAGDAFDFNAWLVQALQRGWLWKAEPIDDTPEESSHDPDLA